MPDLGKKKPRIEVPGLDVDIYGYVTKKLGRTWSRKALNLRYRAQPSLSMASFRAAESTATGARAIRPSSAKDPGFWFVPAVRSHL